jgi:DsbC/DsbD-like thiol-disulfide interchange protein
MLPASAITFVLLALAPWAVAALQEPESGPQVQAELVASHAAIAPGSEFEIGVHLSIPESWHVYWQNPGDTGVPTTARLSAPEGFEVEGPLFPGPLRHEDENGTVSYIHEGELVLFFRVRAPAVIEGTSAKFSSRVKWLVCREACFTGSAELELELAVAAENAAAKDETKKLMDAQRALLPRPYEELQPTPSIEWVSVPVPAGELERFQCRIELAGVERVIFCPDPKSELELARQSLETSGAWVRLALELARKEGDPPEPPRAQGVLRLEKGASIAYFRLDVRRGPQPLPRK